MQSKGKTMTNSSNSANLGVDFGPPMHPGRVMKTLLLSQPEFSLETVSAKSGLSVEWLKNFADGNAEMTRGMRSHLRSAFGEAADTLYRIQLTYNYYQLHGEMPRQYGLRK